MDANYVMKWDISNTVEETLYVPNFSAHLSEAWKLVELLKIECNEVAIHTTNTKQWKVRLVVEGQVFESTAYTAPLAICYAALYRMYI